MGTDTKIVFWPEASNLAGTGHLMECLAIADLLKENGISFSFVINPYSPAEKLLVSKSIAFDVVSAGGIQNTCNAIKQKLQAGCVIINHRNVPLRILKQLKNNCESKIVVVDQLGNKAVACDLLINASIVPQWLEYRYIGKAPERCFGARFAVLRKEFSDLHKKEKKFMCQENTVLVSMGGVDRTGATLNIMKALKLLGAAVKKEIILGSGFIFMDKFRRLYEKIKDPSFSFACGVNDLAQRLKKSDIAISAGGNTLYEMACVGTPGMVLWEDPHERDQSAAFERKGTVLCVGSGVKTSAAKISSSINKLLKDKVERVQMSKNGQCLVDGKGARRIAKKIIELIRA